MSTPSTPDPLAQIKELLFRGEKIEAIKLFREHMKCGLAEAKSAVDKLESELRAQQPDRFTAADKKGCLGVLILGGVLAGILTAELWAKCPRSQGFQAAPQPETRPERTYTAEAGRAQRGKATGEPRISMIPRLRTL